MSTWCQVVSRRQRLCFWCGAPSCSQGTEWGFTTNSVEFLVDWCAALGHDYIMDATPFLKQANRIPGMKQ